MTASPREDSAALASWLERIEANHPSAIELGLERVGLVARAAGLDAPEAPVILVGGTNGKGTVVHRLALAYRFAGYRVGSYFSPHVHRFAERVQIDGVPVDDERLVAAFDIIESARGTTSLTYFEWATLAAMQVFLSAGVDVIVLEVGLGGRLDATNLWDADVSVVTSIDLDHQEWLGDTREAIGFEKIAIGRPGHPLVLGEPDPPPAVVERAEALGVVLHRVDHPDVDRRNGAVVSDVIDALAARRPVGAHALGKALAAPGLPGRAERIELPPHTVLLDVAHNPAAARALAGRLVGDRDDGPVVMVFAVLGDKDVHGVLAPLEPLATRWHLGGLEVARGLPVAELAARIEGARGGGEPLVVSRHDTVEAAWRAARATAPPGARIVVTGSFHTVAAVRRLIDDDLLDRV